MARYLEKKKRQKDTYMESDHDQAQRLSIKKGSWMKEEDDLLRNCIQQYGEGNWSQVPLRAGLNRCRKSCRLRWLNYLKPDIKRGEFAMEEVDLLIKMHKLIGNRWSLIAGRLPGRTANDIKNYWNTHLKKKQPEISNVGMMMKINKVEDDDHKQINSSTTASTRNDKGKLHVIRPKAQRFSEKSKWVMHRGSDHDQPSSSSKVVINSTESTNNHEPLPEVLTDEALTSWWQKNIDLLLINHDDDYERMINKKEVVLQTDKKIVLQTESGAAAADQQVINLGVGCCYKTTTDQSSTMTSKGKEQDLSVDDYSLE